MFKYYLIRENESLKSALILLNRNPDKCLVIESNIGKLLGTLTDGDIRRSIIKGLDFKDKILNIYNKKPFYINKDSIKQIKISDQLLSNYSVIPIVNSKKKIIDLKSKNLINLDKNQKKFTKIDLNKIPVIIMAGGEGKRLLPHTAILPKPLIPYKGISLSEHIINRFKNYGLNNFILTIKYKSNLMKAFFSDFRDDIKISFIYENKSLGTAGSLQKLIKKKSNNFFVINCDTIIKSDYISLLNYHEDNKHDLTIVVCKKKQVFNYGSCIIKKNCTLKEIIEKPSTTHLANTGMYIINKKSIKVIKKNENIGMDQLISRLIKKKYKIGIFPIDEDEWQDLGTWDKFFDPGSEII
jgi:dTDP-glucose pyrophosphorylase